MATECMPCTRVRDSCLLFVACASGSVDGCHPSSQIMAMAWAAWRLVDEADGPDSQAVAKLATDVAKQVAQLNAKNAARMAVMGAEISTLTSEYDSVYERARSAEDRVAELQDQLQDAQEEAVQMVEDAEAANVVETTKLKAQIAAMQVALDVAAAASSNVRNKLLERVQVAEAKTLAMRAELAVARRSNFTLLTRVNELRAEQDAARAYAMRWGPDAGMSPAAEEEEFPASPLRPDEPLSGEIAFDAPRVSVPSWAPAVPGGFDPLMDDDGGQVEQPQGVHQYLRPENARPKRSAHSRSFIVIMNCVCLTLPILLCHRKGLNSWPY